MDATGQISKEDTTKRIVSSVTPPKWEYLASDKLFTTVNGKKVPNVDILKQHLKEEGRLNPTDALFLIKTAAQIFKKEPNLIQLKDPITVCGDVHGQYFDLLKLLSIGGDPKTTKYLFLGDYVDRGYFGTEVCFLLFSYKILYPSSFHMIRGNHECRHLTAYFNFKQECLFKYNQAIYDAFMECFDCLPLTCLLNSRFLCVHGGLSKEITSTEQINAIDRFKEPPSTGPMCDLLWSDPKEDEDSDIDMTDSGADTDFAPNTMRGCSYVFSFGAVDKFLKNNNLLSVIRAHEAQDDGYRLYKTGSTTKFPTVICIFSAPNYCDIYNNKGGIIRFQNNLMNIRQFNYSEHPYYLPNFMNAFTWSLPFVTEKVGDMFTSITNLVTEEEDERDDDEYVDNSNEKDLFGQERIDQIKQKIKTAARFARMSSTLKKEQETISALKYHAGGKIPQGLLLKGLEAMQTELKRFEAAKSMDIENEKRPPTQNGEVELVPDTTPLPAPVLPKMGLGPLKIQKAPKLEIAPPTPVEDSREKKSFA